MPTRKHARTRQQQAERHADDERKDEAGEEQRARNRGTGAMNSPPVINCHSRTSVSENGTMKAALVERPAISHSGDAGEEAEPERRVAAEGLLHVGPLNRHSGAAEGRTRIQG